MVRGVFVGMTTYDVVLDADRAPVDDEKLTAERVEVGPGGPAANAARTFAALGGTALLVTALGHHRIAQALKQQLAAEGVEVVDLAAGDHPPAIASVIVARSGSRTIVSTPPPEPSGVPDPAWLVDASVLLADGHVSSVAVPLARAGTRRGLPLVLDVGRPKPVFDDLLPLAAVPIFAEAWADQDLAALAQDRTRLIAVTAGPRPIRWWAGAESGQIQPSEVSVVSTLGAGDVLHGAVAHGVASGLDPVDAVGRAAQLATDRCRQASLTGWLETLRAKMEPC